MQWLNHFVQTRHGAPSTAIAPLTEGLIITSAWRYDLVLWLQNLLVGGKWQALRNQTIDLARLQPGEAILDVGCGTGTLALLAKQRVGPDGQVVGIDPSMAMIARARKKATQRKLRADFHVGVIERLTLPDQSFDVVLSTFMMHVLPDDLKRQGLAEIARVLKPGGRVLIIDFKRPEAHQDQRKRPVHTGPWNSGIQDQPRWVKKAGFTGVETGELDPETRLLPEIGYVLGSK